VAIDFAEVVERDRGLRQIRRQLAQYGASGSVVEVGFLGRPARKIHRPDYVASNLEIAYFHEFGTKTIPRRSMIGGWAQERASQIAGILAYWVEETLAGRTTNQRALDNIGVWAVGSIQTRMGRGIAPELAESTKRSRKKPKKAGTKGQSGYTPLIDTGQLRASISSRSRL